MSQIDINQNKNTNMYEETGDYPMNSSFKAVVDINVIPEGWSLDRFIEIANEKGYMFVDMSKSTNKPAVKFSNNETTTLENAISILVNHLNKDEDYRMEWVANIAIAFQDEFEDWCKNKVGRKPDPKHVRDISNNAANRFLDNLTYTEGCDCCKKKRCCVDSNCLKIKTIDITLNKDCYIPELKLWEHTFYGNTTKSPGKRIRYVTEDVNDVVTQLDFTEIDNFKIID